MLGEGVMTDEYKDYEVEAESRWSELYRAWLKNQAAWAAQPDGVEASRLRDECVDLVVKMVVMRCPARFIRQKFEVIEHCLSSHRTRPGRTRRNGLLRTSI